MLNYVDMATCHHQWRIYHGYHYFAKCLICGKRDRGMDQDAPDNPGADYYRKKYGITTEVEYLIK